MSYVVTARKWRPHRFADVISQRHVTDTLKNAITHDRVGHAYLFSGPRGVGKTTVARIFAKALNCEHGPAEEPCNECDNCRAIQSGGSMDVQEMDGASNNSVEDVRSLISSVGYHASSCRYKMYIIDEVHMLSLQAFNALLKTLEEPPPNVIFVFATTEPHKIPVTILSRCQRFDFHRLSVNDIGGKLRTIAENDGIDIDDESVMLIAQRAGGAMRDGESILEQLKSSRGGTISVTDVYEVLGIADRDVFFSIMEKCRDADVAGALQLFRTYYEEGGDLKEFIEGMLGHLRDMLYAGFEGGIEQVMLTDELRKRVAGQASWFGRGDIIRFIGMMTDVESSLAYAVLPVLRIETALAKMASMERTVQLKELFERLGGASAVGEMKAAATGTSRPAPAPAGAGDMQAAGVVEMVSPAEEPSAGETPEPDNDGGIPETLSVKPDIESIRASWELIVAAVGAEKQSIAPALLKAVPAGFGDGVLEISFSAGQEYHVKTVEAGTPVIERQLTAVLGTPTRIRCTVEGPAETAADGGQKKNHEHEDLIAREPVIGEILERFQGEIIDTWRDTHE